MKTKKPDYSVIIDKDEDEDRIVAFHFGIHGDGDTEFVCSRKINKDAKEPLIATVVDLTDCIAENMKGKNYVLSYLMVGRKK